LSNFTEWNFKGKFVNNLTSMVSENFRNTEHCWSLK
jgi:hypothetical protein